MKNTFRWTLVNRKSNKVRNSYATRSAARDAKKASEKIYDRINATYVR